MIRALKDFSDDGITLEPSAASRAVAQRRADTARASGTGGQQQLQIPILGEVGENMLCQVMERLHNAPGAEAITLMIDSGGGCPYAAAFIHRLVRLHSAPVKIAKMMNRCRSAALIVAIAADRRVASAGTGILLHPSRISLRTGSDLTRSDLIEQARLLEYVDCDIVDIVAHRTGADAAVIAAEAATEEDSSLDWCLRHNIIHAIEGGQEWAA